MTKFVGSKSASGAAQQIVSMLPAHDVFVEAFAGRGAVSLLKKPARYTFLYEKNPQTANDLLQLVNRSRLFRNVYFYSDGGQPYPLSLPTLPDDCNCFVICEDVFNCLPSLLMAEGNVCMYCDPPYMRSVRRDPHRDYYFHDWPDDAHVGFLEWATAANFPVAISGYASEFYNLLLPRWHTRTFGVGTRGGRALEKVWMNYDPAAVVLHDARFVGNSFTDRQRIKRKAARWVRRLVSMEAAERQAVLDAVHDYERSTSCKK